MSQAAVHIWDMGALTGILTFRPNGWPCIQGLKIKILKCDTVLVPEEKKYQPNYGSKFRSRNRNIDTLDSINMNKLYIRKA